MKKKKKLEILSLYTCVPKTTIMWGTVPQIRSETIFFCHFGPLFALLTPPKNPEKQNFEEMKKASGDHFQLVIISVIILNLYNKEHDHMMYAYSDTECDRHDFLSF